jgi:hypothetical protein
VANYQDFFSTQPPLFSKVEEPIDADAWLRTIESKFALLTILCADSSKAHVATQQLHGAARIQWANYCAMQADGHVISWEEFRNAFRAHHIPEGLMAPYCNMHRLLITCVSTWAITRIVTPRSRTVSVGA